MCLQILLALRDNTRQFFSAKNVILIFLIAFLKSFGTFYGDMTKLMYHRRFNQLIYDNPKVEAQFSIVYVALKLDDEVLEKFVCEHFEQVVAYSFKKRPIVTVALYS